MTRHSSGCTSKAIFCFALTKPSDWLKADAEAALEEYDVHTSLTTYNEFLVYFYDPEAAEYTLPVTDLIPNLLELVPVRPAADDFLERDDVIDDGEFPDEQNLIVDRLDRRVYLVRLTDDGSIPDVEEAEAIQRITSQHLLQGGALGHESTSESEEEPAARRLM